MGRKCTRGEALEKFGRICKKTEEIMHGAKIPGVALGILYDGEVLSTGLGVTSVENPLTVDDQTLFQIGSVTKTVVATAVMCLVEHKIVDLDKPVKHYLPELKLSDKQTNEEITLRSILTHTCGFTGDYFRDFGYGDDALSKIVEEIKELPQNYPMGKYFSYCNSGYYVAGRVLEVVTGKTFESAIKELVFEPLGMQHAFFFPWDVMTHRFVVGHHEDQGTLTIAEPWQIGRASHPAGGIITNVRELLKYARFHCGDGTTDRGQRILSQESLRQLHTPGIRINPATRIGLSWFVSSIDEVTLIAHGGGTNGQICELVIAPEKGFATVALTNALSGSAVTSIFSKLSFEEFLGLSQEDLEEIKLSNEKTREYLGKYEGEISDIKLYPDDKKLMLQVIPKGGFPDRDSPPFPAPPPAEVVFVGKDIIAPSQSRYATSSMTFIRDEEGKITMLQSGRLFRKTG